MNLIQYYGAVILNKNQKALKNKAIKVDIILVVITIILPICFILIKTEFQITMVPVLILLYFGFKKINTNAHKLYLKEEEEISEEKAKFINLILNRSNDNNPLPIAIDSHLASDIIKYCSSQPYEEPEIDPEEHAKTMQEFKESEEVTEAAGDSDELSVKENNINE